MRSTKSGAVALLGAGLILTGCSHQASYSAETAQSLQQRVLAIATSAKSRDYAGALSQLSQLQQADDLALSNGTITRARHDAISATITEVRADLTTLEAPPSPSPSAPPSKPKRHPQPPKPQPKHGHGDGGGNGNGNGDGGD